MKKKVIISISILVLLLTGILLISEKYSIFKNEYKDVLDKINDKSTFNLLITNDADIKRIFDYYKDVYGLDYEYLNIDEKNEKYNKIIEETSPGMPPHTENIFYIIKNGEVLYSLTGNFTEKELKAFLIANNIISIEYKDIDTIIADDYDKYLKDNNGYCILYLSDSDNDLYKYKEIFVKNKIRSLIMYFNNTSNQKSESYFKSKLEFKENINSKLPMVIRIKFNKVLNTYNNVTLDNLTDKCKS